MSSSISCIFFLNVKAVQPPEKEYSGKCEMTIVRRNNAHIVFCVLRGFYHSSSLRGPVCVSVCLVTTHLRSLAPLFGCADSCLFLDMSFVCVVWVFVGGCG